MNTWLPKINNINKFSNIVNNISQSEKYIGYLGFEHPPYLGNLASKNSEYCLLIGPEGDFTKEEINLAIESGFSVVSLGGSRLRTETAGITGCFILNGINYE